MSAARVSALVLGAVVVVLVIVAARRQAARTAAADAELRELLGPFPTDERIETYAQLLHDEHHRMGTASTCGTCRARAAAAALPVPDVPTPRTSP